MSELSMSEQFKPSYQSEYQKNLHWIQKNPHLQQARTGEQKNYFGNVCKAVAGAISILNLQETNPLPTETRGVKWQAFQGSRRDNPDDVRAAFTIELSYLSELTGLHLPDVRDLSPENGPKEQFITVIWQSSGKISQLSNEECGEENFVSAYPVSYIDKVLESRQPGARKSGQDYWWDFYGRAEERADFISSLLKRLEGD